MRIARLLAVLTIVGTMTTLAEVEKTEKLPSRKSDKWGDYFTAYEQRGFDAVMAPDATIRIYFKGNGDKYVGEPVIFGRLRPYYVEDRQYHERRIKYFYDAPKKPLSDPKKIVLRGEFEDGVEFEVVYEFSGSKLTASGGYQDPPGLKPPTIFRIMTSIPPSHKFDPEMPQEERAKALKGMELKTREIVEGRRKSFEYDYAKSLTFSGLIDRAEIRGAWGDHKVKIYAKKTDQFRGWVYSGYCPYQGYHFYFNAQDNEIKRYKAEQIIEID